MRYCWQAVLFFWKSVRAIWWDSCGNWMAIAVGNSDQFAPVQDHQTDSNS